MWGATWGVVAKCCDAFFSLLLLSPFLLSSPLPPPPFQARHQIANVRSCSANELADRQCFWQWLHS